MQQECGSREGQGWAGEARALSQGSAGPICGNGCRLRAGWAAAGGGLGCAACCCWGGARGGWGAGRSPAAFSELGRPFHGKPLFSRLFRDPPSEKVFLSHWKNSICSSDAPTHPCAAQGFDQHWPDTSLTGAANGETKRRSVDHKHWHSCVCLWAYPRVPPKGAPAAQGRAMPLLSTDPSPLHHVVLLITPCVLSIPRLPLPNEPQRSADVGDGLLPDSRQLSLPAALRQAGPRLLLRPDIWPGWCVVTMRLGALPCCMTWHPAARLLKLPAAPSLF